MKKNNKNKQRKKENQIIDRGNGKFSILFADGNKYYGQLNEQKQVEGYGEMTYTNDDLILKYIGNFKNGLPNGYGETYLKNGTIQKGQFIDGQLNGQGTTTLPLGTAGIQSYDGNFKNGKFDGTGKITYPENAQNKKQNPFKTFFCSFKENKPIAPCYAKIEFNNLILYKLYEGNLAAPMTMGGEGTLTTHNDKIISGNFGNIKFDNGTIWGNITFNHQSNNSKIQSLISKKSIISNLPASIYNIEDSIIYSFIGTLDRNKNPNFGYLMIEDFNKGFVLNYAARKNPETNIMEPSEKDNAVIFFKNNLYNFYYGKINKENLPQGEGKLFIKEEGNAYQIIEGIFKNTSIANGLLNAQIESIEEEKPISYKIVGSQIADSQNQEIYQNWQENNNNIVSVPNYFCHDEAFFNKISNIYSTILKALENETNQSIKKTEEKNNLTSTNSNIIALSAKQKIEKPSLDNEFFNNATKYWYDDQDIDQIAQKLCHNSPSFIYLPCFEEGQDLDSKKLIWQNILQNNSNFSNKNSIIHFLTAQRINGNHWVNIVVEFNFGDKKANFKLYNPLQQIGEMPNKLFANLKEFFAENIKAIPKENYCNLITICNEELQQDSSSCGKIVLSNMEELIKGNSIEDQQQYEKEKIAKIIQNHIELYPQIIDKINNQSSGLIEAKLLNKDEFSPVQIAKINNKTKLLNSNTLTAEEIAKFHSFLNENSQINEISQQKNAIFKFLDQNSIYQNLQNEFFITKNNQENIEFKNELTIEEIAEITQNLLSSKIATNFLANYQKSSLEEKYEIENNWLYTPESALFLSYLQSTNSTIEADINIWKKAEKLIYEEILSFNLNNQTSKAGFEPLNKQNNSAISPPNIDFAAINYLGEKFNTTQLIEAILHLAKCAKATDNFFGQNNQNKTLEEFVKIFKNNQNNNPELLTILKCINNSLENICKAKVKELDIKNYHSLSLKKKEEFFEKLLSTDWFKNLNDNLIYYIPQYLVENISFENLAGNLAEIEKLNLHEFKKSEDIFLLLINYVTATQENNQLLKINIPAYLSSNPKLEENFIKKSREILNLLENNKNLSLENICNYYFGNIRGRSTFSHLPKVIFNNQEFALSQENIAEFTNKHNQKNYQIAFLPEIKEKIKENFEEWKKIAICGFVGKEGQQGIKHLGKNIFEIKPKSANLENERCYALQLNNLLLVIKHGTKNNQKQDIETIIKNSPPSKTLIKPLENKEEMPAKLTKNLAKTKK